MMDLEPRARGRKKMSPFDHLLRDLASRFLSGVWRRRAPDEPGLYAIAGRDGGFIGYCLVAQRGEELRYIRIFGDRKTPYMEASNPREVHVGWWFSQPVPALPAAPRWRD